MKLSMIWMLEIKYDVLKWWKYYRPRLVPDLVRVAHMLCPHPKVMEVVKTTPDPEDRNAVERMIDKLLLPLDIVDLEEKMEKSAELIDTFWKEHESFLNKTGHFISNPRIWIIAAKEDTLAFEWHSKYSLHHTTVFGSWRAGFVLR